MLQKLSFFWSYFDGLDNLAPEDQLAVYRAIIRYGFLQEEPELTGTPAYIFGLIKPNLDVSISYAKGGASGGKAKAKPEPSPDEAQAKPTSSPSQAQAKPEPSPEEPDIGYRIKDKGIRNKDIGERNKDTGKKELKKADKRPFDEIEDPEIKAAALGFREMRKSQRKPMTPRAEELLLAKLYKMASDDFGDLIPSKAVELLDNSTTKGWLDIYPVKESKKSTSIFDEIANA